MKEIKLSLSSAERLVDIFDKSGVKYFVKGLDAFLKGNQPFVKVAYPDKYVASNDNIQRVFERGRI